MRNRTGGGVAISEFGSGRRSIVAHFQRFGSSGPWTRATPRRSLPRAIMFRPFGPGLLGRHEPGSPSPIGERRCNRWTKPFCSRRRRDGPGSSCPIRGLHMNACPCKVGCRSQFRRVVLVIPPLGHSDLFRISCFGFRIWLGLRRAELQSRRHGPFVSSKTEGGDQGGCSSTRRIQKAGGKPLGLPPMIQSYLSAVTAA